MYQSPPEGTALCWLGCSRCDRFLFEIEKTTVILYWVPALRFRMVQGRGLCVYRCGFFFRSHLHSFLCRILSRAWVPCEAWRPMTTPTTRPAALREGSRAGTRERKKVGGTCARRAQRAREARERPSGRRCKMFWTFGIHLFFWGSKYLHLHAV